MTLDSADKEEIVMDVEDIGEFYYLVMLPESEEGYVKEFVLFEDLEAYMLKIFTDGSYVPDVDQTFFFKGKRLELKLVTTSKLQPTEKTPQKTS